MTNATDTDIQQLKDLITAGNLATQKQIADIALSSQQQIFKLEQRMEVGFANVETKFANIETKFSNIETQFTKLEGDIENRFTKLEGGIENRFTKLEGGIENRFTKLEGDIATLSSGVQNFEKRMSEIKNDQRAQDQRFFGLSIFIITSAVGIAAKLAKLY